MLTLVVMLQIFQQCKDGQLNLRGGESVLKMTQVRDYLKLSPP